jgi:MOSC domain-containing protein YiiM
MAILESINVGSPQPIPGKTAQTGIYKKPVAGEVSIGKNGIEGDAVIDRKHHGGPDQALYLYFADDYQWWAAELGQALEAGTFGENLTIAGVEGRAVAPGDRFVMDEIVLEVTSHRTPCGTFARRMDDRMWVKRFHAARRPGAYCRVISPGTLHAGEPVRYLPFAGERVTVAELMALDGVSEPDPAILRRALAAPIHYKMRADFEEKLARLF